MEFLPVYADHYNSVEIDSTYSGLGLLAPTSSLLTATDSGTIQLFTGGRSRSIEYPPDSLFWTLKGERRAGF